MKSYLKLTLCLLYIFFISCTQESREIKKFTLQSDTTIHLELDSLTPVTSLSLWYFLDTDTNKEYISYARNKSSYVIFDLSTLSDRLEINLIKEGPNAVPDVRGGLFPLSLNKYLIGGMFTPTLYVIDSNRHLVNKSNYTLDRYPFGSNTDAGTTLYGNRPFFLHNNKIYGSDFMFGPFGNWDKGHVLKKDLFVGIDTTNGGKGSFLPINIPSTVWDDGDRMVLPLYDYANGKLVLSNSHNHELWVYDLYGNYQSFEAKSAYIDDFDDYNLGFSPSEYFKYYVKNGAYNSIIYDAYRNVYYRFFIHPYQADEEINWVRAKKNPEKVSVIILDERFNVIGEHVLPENTHYIYNVFVGKDGLYISNSHIDNPDLQEDVLSFTVYSLTH